MVRMKLFLALILASVAPARALAQMEFPSTSVEPFKVGTFEVDGRQTVGLVLRDQLIVELDAANAALQGDPGYPAVAMPEDMLGLIGQYEYGLRYRLYEIVNDLVRNNRLSGGGRRAYVHDLDDVRTLAPILYPGRSSTRRSTSTATSTKVARPRSAPHRCVSARRIGACHTCS